VLRKKKSPFCNLNTSIYCHYHLHTCLSITKGTMRILMAVNSKSPCEPIFKALKIPTVAAEYIFSLITLLAHNFEYFTLNSSIHRIYKRRRLQLHRPATNHASHQEGVYVTNIKICILLQCIADLVEDTKQFVQPLRDLFMELSFYSIDLFLYFCVTQMEWLCYEECITFCK